MYYNVSQIYLILSCMEICVFKTLPDLVISLYIFYPSTSKVSDHSLFCYYLSQHEWVEPTIIAHCSGFIKNMLECLSRTKYSRIKSVQRCITGRISLSHGVSSIVIIYP